MGFPRKINIPAAKTCFMEEAFRGKYRKNERKLGGIARLREQSSCNNRTYWNHTGAKSSIKGENRLARIDPFG